MGNLILKKEFFGGIIYDDNTKENIAIDKETYNLIQMLSDIQYEKNVEELQELDKNDIFEMLRELVKLGVVKIDIKNANNKASENYLSAPFRIFYDITYKCNLRCKHCFTESGVQKKLELTLKEKFNLINQIKELGIQKISIAGGEPFCSEDIYFFIEECNRNNISVSITTNGTIFNEEVILKLNELKISNLTISFDGGNEKSFDFVRGSGTFYKVTNNLELLKKYYKGKYSLKTTLMKNNINQIEDIIRIGIKYKCDTVKFNTVREDGRAITNKINILISQDEYIKTIQNIEKLRSKYSDLIKIRAPLNIYCDEDYEYIEELGFGCFAGKESICVDPLGNVRPCSHYPDEFICGNVKENTLTDIWNNSHILKNFREFEGNETCNNCDSYDHCRGGCRYRCYLNGDINGVDTFCFLHKNC